MKKSYGNAHRWALLALCLSLLASMSVAQAVSGQVVQPSASSAYVSPYSVPSPVRGYLQAFGSRIQSPGITAGTSNTLIQADTGHIDAEEEWLNAASGTYTSSFHLSNLSNSWIIYVATFKAGP